ncbi:hypothetical protein AMAG_14258 [Allomyces macrogynus ATCC 38327]|uniref:Uncharacterized protein n=1 Tax=Allomyces macrogynus (strain ATCC 38327) TaxID=578462 RepID=A0A0L0T4P8_ALLM3|nr:hypothetical protein AMAG_14258 [Allomyces macrogynus ATCC 38327]|eukprot:KNE69712.1 hypothetical protein AMAG_14258 [Allomyces macrogynus ATCC 38327]
MASPTGDSAAAHLTTRDFESWDSDIFGSPAHPLIGPTGAPGYWDRASIAAEPTSPDSPDSLRNCTFVTLNPTHDATVYYGPTCPPAPRNPFADPSCWFGLLAPFAVFGLFLSVFAIKDKMDAEPHVTWSEWAKRAWRAVVKWVRSWSWVSALRARVAKEERAGASHARVPRVCTVEPTVANERGSENVRTCEGGQVRWIAADASAATEMEGLGEQRGKVQWWRWTESSESGSGYMLVDSAGAPAPAVLAPSENGEPDEDGAPPPYSTKTGSSARWS